MKKELEHAASTMKESDMNIENLEDHLGKSNKKV
jgi:hypothetical protein